MALTVRRVGEKEAREGVKEPFREKSKGIYKQFPCLIIFFIYLLSESLTPGTFKSFLIRFFHALILIRTNALDL